jgi:transposase
MLTGFGHEVRLIAPKFVRPYVKTQKNDMADAEAIVEAATPPTMRFVERSCPNAWCKRLRAEPLA